MDPALRRIDFDEHHTEELPPLLAAGNADRVGCDGHALASSGGSPTP